MIVQSANVSEVHKLYVNQSMDLHTPVTGDAKYQVSIFAIREGMGILGPTGQCNVVTVSATDVTSAPTTVHAISTRPPRSDPSATVQSSRLIFLIEGFQLTETFPFQVFHLNLVIIQIVYHS